MKPGSAPRIRCHGDRQRINFACQLLRELIPTACEAKWLGCISPWPVCGPLTVFDVTLLHENTPSKHRPKAVNCLLLRQGLEVQHYQAGYALYAGYSYTAGAK